MSEALDEIAEECGVVTLTEEELDPTEVEKGEQFGYESGGGR